MRSYLSSARPGALAGLLALASFAALAAAPARTPEAGRARPDVRTAPERPVRPPVVAAVVTDVDPAAALGGQAALTSQNLGPFDAQETLTLYVLAVYDRTRVGKAPFDQRLRLILPDGGVYEDRVAPVDPAALAGKTVQREDLGPDPVAVQVPARMLRLARALPGHVPAVAQRDATFTTEPLAVSGTWITKHGLYGEWTAEVLMERDGQVIGSARTTFRLENRR